MFASLLSESDALQGPVHSSPFATSGEVAPKRRSHSSALGGDPEDLLSNILGRLGLEAGDTVASDHDQAVEVLMEILIIDRETAGFFLDSAANDVAVAVSLHLDLGGSSGGGGKRARSSSSAPVGKWVHREVEIVGLPEGWKALVSSRTGNIYFQHAESGHTQYDVPPGFADANVSDDGDAITDVATTTEADESSMFEAPPPTATDAPMGGSEEPMASEA
jgi:hypothetical protein